MLRLIKTIVELNLVLSFTKDTLRTQIFTKAYFQQNISFYVVHDIFFESSLSQKLIS